MTRIILRALNGPILIALVILAIALQSSLFSSWPLSYFQPDTVLIVVIWCALRRRFEEGGIITLILANISEIHSSVPQGLFLMSYMFIYLAMRSISRFFVIPNLFSYSILAIVGSLIWNTFNFIIVQLLGGGTPHWQHFVLTLILGVAVEFALSLWIYRWLERYDWITFKNAKAEHAMDEELQLDSEGF